MRQRLMPFEGRPPSWERPNPCRIWNFLRELYGENCCDVQFVGLFLVMQARRSSKIAKWIGSLMRCHLTSKSDGFANTKQRLIRRLWDLRRRLMLSQRLQSRPWPRFEQKSRSAGLIVLTLSGQPPSWPRGTESGAQPSMVSGEHVGASSNFCDQSQLPRTRLFMTILRES